MANLNANGISPPKLPALRMTPEGRCVIEDEVPLDLASNSRFTVSFPSGARSNSVLQLPRPFALDSFHTDSEAALEQVVGDYSPVSTRSELPPTGTKDSFFQLPPFSRSTSMPSPSQLSQLQHPHKVDRAGPSRLPSSSREPPYVKELSFELADSIQMVVQTLLQVSPPQVLDITKEQFSACSLSVPTSSMSAMFTVMKNINYLSAHMPLYFEEPPISSKSAEKRPMQNDEETSMEFDIGEMLQCIGDSLSGTAAQAGVDLVIYHEEVSLKHVNVAGDEAGLSYAISHLIRQILNVAERGDTVELGLLLVPAAPTGGESSTSSADIPLQCTIRISHRFAFPERLPNHPYGPEPEQIREQPSFSSLLLRRILRQTSGSLRGDLPPPENFASGRTVELTFPLRRPRSSLAAPSEEATNSEVPQFHHDPTLRQLVIFAETLKGKKATLYASPDACFAQHLTSYLTEWGMEVTHVSPGGNVDGTGAPDASPVAADGVSPVEKKAGEPDPMSFVFIDDDVDVLKERLLAQRSEYNALLVSQMVPKKRPPLSSLHRPRSTVNVPSHMPAPKTPNVIMHFTSLSNYKHLKEVVQSIMASFSAATIPLPEVMILPKPAGPRRFLTALHTAATKPSVDLPFIPIATSPLSPGLATGSFFGSFPGPSEQQQSPKPSTNGSQPVSPIKLTRPTGSRTNSDRSLKSTAQSEANSPPPVTPSLSPENLEYFASAAQRFGTTPSSGMVLQSPDGIAAGIFFRPQTKAPRASSSTDRDQKSPRRKSASRPSANGPEGTPSFSALYSSSSASTVTRARPVAVNGEHAESPVMMSPLLTFATDKERMAALAMHATASSSSNGSLKDKPPSPATSPRNEEAKTTASSSTTRPESPVLRRRNQRKMNTVEKDGPSPAPAIKKPKPGDHDIIPPISVLIVDDNPINQTILSTFMKRKKIKYDIANNGEEAVHKWKTGTFHLILMDIQMPVMDGIQATKEIRKMEKYNALAGFPPLTPTGEGQRTPSDTSSTTESRAAPSPYRSSVIIVALTASSLQSDRDAALAAGCNDFLTKPVSLLWLNNKIIEWGSIKALQVWADIRPDVNRMNTGQAIQAKAVADKLQVPSKGKPQKPPSPTPRRTSSLNKEEGAAALALASSASRWKKPVTSSVWTAEPISMVKAQPMQSRPSTTESEDELSEASSSGLGTELSLRKDSADSTTLSIDDDSSKEDDATPHPPNGVSSFKPTDDVEITSSAPDPPDSTTEEAISSEPSPSPTPTLTSVLANGQATPTNTPPPGEPDGDR